MKFYHILEWGEEYSSPTIIANSPAEAGQKYIEKHFLPFVLVGEREDTACFVDPKTLPENKRTGFNPDTNLTDQERDKAVYMFVEPVCLFKEPCIECKGYYQHGINLALMEDIEFLAKLMEENKVEERSSQ